MLVVALLPIKPPLPTVIVPPIVALPEVVKVVIPANACAAELD